MLLVWTPPHLLPHIIVDKQDCHRSLVILKSVTLSAIDAILKDSGPCRLDRNSHSQLLENNDLVKIVMAKNNKFKSDASEAIHSSAAMLHKAGVLDKTTMRDFDARHLAVPIKNQIGEDQETAQGAQCRAASIRPVSPHERKHI